MCPVDYAVNLLSGKYKLRILHALLQESPQRFKVLERSVSFPYLGRPQIRQFHL